MTTARTFNFTDKAIASLPIPAKPLQVDYFDADTKGFGLRVSYGGRRTFFLMYSDADKKRQRVSLGEYGRLEDGRLSLAAARKRATVKLGEIAKDRSPAAEAREARQAATVETLTADFIKAQRKQGKKTADRQERRLARDVLPMIGHKKAREVERTDIKKIMDAITERGAPIEANRVHEDMRAMFAFGIEEEVYGLLVNPADRLGKHRNPENPRDRWLALDEIARYWRALDDEPSGGAAALKLCHLTAQRQGNVLGMRLDQLALDDGLWIIPASTTKTSRTYRVPLSRIVVEIIKDRIAEIEEAETRRAKREHRDPKPTTWLFPKRGDDGPADHTLVQKPHASACERAKIEGYRLHDARHTFATHCDQMGFSRLVWDGILGHIGTGMADLYSGHDFADRRRECAEAWANRIAASLGGNVVSLDTAKRA